MLYKNDRRLRYCTVSARRIIVDVSRIEGRLSDRQLPLVQP
jgi:hypothetical protein